MLKAIIVDDEEWAIKRLNRLLSETDWLDVRGTFQHPREAYEYAQSNRVDVAFLDVSMPHINGMALSELLTGLDEKTLIVFVTGYEQYAVRAFDLNALDYLVKPIDEDRLARTVGKIRKARPAPAPERDPGTSVFLFNGFKVCAGDGKPMKLRSPKTEELFGFLVCRRTVTRDEVIETLWPALEHDKASGNLNTNLYYIRKSLAISKPQSWLHASRNEISIDTDSLYCDVYELDAVIKRVAASGLDDIAWVERAESLYTGPFLQGRDYPWSGEMARHYEQAYLGLLEAAARFGLSAGRQDTALHYYNKIVEKDKLREDVYVEIIRIYLSAGRRVDAVRCLRELERHLAMELGVGPSPAVTRLFENVMW